MIILQNNLCPSFFTARRYAERGYEIACRLSVRLSVCLSVCLSVRPSVRDVEVCFSRSLEYFENNFTAE